MLDDAHAGAGELRPALEALMLDLERLHHNTYTGRLRAPVGACVKEMADAARKALTSGPLLQPICNACGGTRVRVDAWACWDAHAQRWALHSTYEAAAICADCDGECRYSMRLLAGTG